MNIRVVPCTPPTLGCANRRAVLKSALQLVPLAMVGGSLIAAPEPSAAAALTKDERDRLPPDQIVEAMKLGNERFRSGKMSRQNKDSRLDVSPYRRACRLLRLKIHIGRLEPRNLQQNISYVNLALARKRRLG